MTNIILFSHGQLAVGLADSCKLIIGENRFKVLNILLDQSIEQIEHNLDNVIDGFSKEQPIVIVTDIPGGSTTQTAIKKISQRKKRLCSNRNEFRIGYEFIFFIII